MPNRDSEKSAVDWAPPPLPGRNSFAAAIGSLLFGLLAVVSAVDTSDVVGAFISGKLYGSISIISGLLALLGAIRGLRNQTGPRDLLFATIFLLSLALGCLCVLVLLPARSSGVSGLQL